MSPFEEIYGRAPPSLLDYLDSTLHVKSVDDLLTNRTTILQTLLENLQRAQAKRRT